MLVLKFTPFPVLTTERLVLRKVDKYDVNEFFMLRSDKVVMKYLDRAPAKTQEDALVFIQKINDLEKNNEGITWAIVLKGEKKLIGTICFWNIAKEHYRAEIGYVLLPGFHGKGIMQEALTAVLNYGFKIMKLHSVEANVNPLNNASIRLLERNKFLREAYYKENYFYNGQFLDSAVYSLLSP